MPLFEIERKREENWSDRFCIVRSDRRRNRLSIVDFLLNSPKKKKNQRNRKIASFPRRIICLSLVSISVFFLNFRNHFHNRDNNSEFANYATRCDQDVGSDLADRKIDVLYRYRVRSKWADPRSNFPSQNRHVEMLGNSGFFVFFFSPCRA